MSKSNHSDSEPKLVTYKEYKKIFFENFSNSLNNALRHFKKQQEAMELCSNFEPKIKLQLF